MQNEEKQNCEIITCPIERLSQEAEKYTLNDTSLPHEDTRTLQFKKLFQIHNNNHLFLFEHHPNHKYFLKESIPPGLEIEEKTKRILSLSDSLYKENNKIKLYLSLSPSSSLPHSLFSFTIPFMVLPLNYWEREKEKVYNNLSNLLTYYLSQKRETSLSLPSSLSSSLPSPQRNSSTEWGYQLLTQATFKHYLFPSSTSSSPSPHLSSPISPLPCKGGGEKDYLVSLHGLSLNGKEVQQKGQEILLPYWERIASLVHESIVLGGYEKAEHPVINILRLDLLLLFPGSEGEDRGEREGEERGERDGEERRVREEGREEEERRGEITMLQKAILPWNSNDGDQYKEEVVQGIKAAESDLSLKKCFFACNKNGGDLWGEEREETRGERDKWREREKDNWRKTGIKRDEVTAKDKRRFGRGGEEREGERGEETGEERREGERGEETGEGKREGGIVWSDIKPKRNQKYDFSDRKIKNLHKKLNIIFREWTTEKPLAKRPSAREERRKEEWRGEGRREEGRGGEGRREEGREGEERRGEEREKPRDSLVEKVVSPKKRIRIKRREPESRKTGENSTPLPLSALLVPEIALSSLPGKETETEVKEENNLPFPTLLSSPISPISPLSKGIFPPLFSRHKLLSSQKRPPFPLSSPLENRVSPLNGDISLSSLPFSPLKEEEDTVIGEKKERISNFLCIEEKKKKMISVRKTKREKEAANSHRSSNASHAPSHSPSLQSLVELPSPKYHGTNDKYTNGTSRVTSSVTSSATSISTSVTSVTSSSDGVSDMKGSNSATSSGTSEEEERDGKGEEEGEEERRGEEREERRRIAKGGCVDDVTGMDEKTTSNSHFSLSVTSDDSSETMDIPFLLRKRSFHLIFPFSFPWQLRPEENEEEENEKAGEEREESKRNVYNNINSLKRIQLSQDNNTTTLSLLLEEVMKSQSPIYHLSAS